MTEQDQFQKVEEIFHESRKLPTTDRAEFLDRACEEDLELRAEVESLLTHSDDSKTERLEVSPSGEGFMAVMLDREDTPQTLVDRGPVSEGPGTIIGRYKILQQIGEGGFGVVYMAEQTEPVNRKVALKIIKLGMDTKQVIARFEAERQALAMMEHPNIAKVFDAGATETGRPYFVMELVKGIPITDYCDMNKLSTRDRLLLFMDVCNAVQHAHQKGIIHRDIKPSNVLVTLHDDIPVPKVIDFGIAKATSHRLTEKTLFTEFRQFIGTPEYMSPDQAEISGLDVDTRTDIYSLGVLLYELLTSTTPFDGKTLRSKGHGELQRIIKEVDPPRPSNRVETLITEAGGPDIARQRRSEPGNLSRVMRGDLDWIVMKAIEKDRTRRYQTASELAADIRRHLEQEPVVAGPPNVVYRSRKFMLRHRVGVVAGVIVVAAVLVGAALAAVGFVEARQEARRSQRIADFLQDLFISTNPEEMIARDLDVKSVMTEARSLFGDDHATVASLLNSQAGQLQSAGHLEAAEALYEESLRIWREQSGGENTNIASTKTQLGLLLHTKGDEEGAEAAFRDAIRILRAQEGDEKSLLLCEPLALLASVVVNRGDHETAIASLRESADIRIAVAPHQRLQIALTLHGLANVLAIAGKQEELFAFTPETIQAWRDAVPEDSILLGQILAEYGVVYRRAGEHDMAEQFFREAWALLAARPGMAMSHHGLALRALFNTLEDKEDWLGQIEVGIAALKIAPDLEAGRYTEEIARDLGNVAWRIAREPDRAGDDYRTALTAIERSIQTIREEAARAEEPKPPDVRALLNTLGVIQYRLGEYDDALATLNHSHELYVPDYERGVPANLAFIAMAHAQLGHDEEARNWLEQLRQIMQDPIFASPEDNATHFAEAEALIGSSPGSGE